MTDTMQAVRFVADGRKLEVTEVPIPTPRPHEALVRVEACGICLSDVHLIDGSIPPVTAQVIPGHESCGVVVATGEMARSWKEGERVVIAGGRPCLTCEMCRTGRMDECRAFELMGFHYDGAWAEYVVVPAPTMTPVPDGIPSEQAAILADAVATPYAAVTDRAALRPGETIGLWGIGGLGTHAVQIARLVGASLIVAVDPLPSARERALALGADAAFDPTDPNTVRAIKEMSGGGLDVAIDLVGANAVIQQCVESLGRGGRAVMVGLSIEPLQLEPSILFGILSHSVLGHLGYRKKHLDELVKLVDSGRLDVSGSISDVMPLDQAPEGVRRLAEKDGDPVRLVVRPGV